MGSFEKKKNPKKTGNYEAKIMYSSDDIVKLLCFLTSAHLVSYSFSKCFIFSPFIYSLKLACSKLIYNKAVKNFTDRKKKKKGVCWPCLQSVVHIRKINKMTWLLLETFAIHQIPVGKLSLFISMMYHNKRRHDKTKLGHND